MQIRRQIFHGTNKKDYKVILSISNLEDWITFGSEVNIPL